MNRPLSQSLALLCIVALPLAAVPVQAQFVGNELVRGLARYDDKGGISIDEAVKMVERMFNARVVRADVDDQQGRKVYVLRLLSERGRVWSVTVDAATGALL